MVEEKGVDFMLPYFNSIGTECFNDDKKIFELSMSSFLGLFRNRVGEGRKKCWF